MRLCVGVCGPVQADAGRCGLGGYMEPIGCVTLCKPDVKLAMWSAPFTSHRSWQLGLSTALLTTPRVRCVCACVQLPCPCLSWARPAGCVVHGCTVPRMLPAARPPLRPLVHIAPNACAKSYTLPPSQRTQGRLETPHKTVKTSMRAHHS